MTKLFSAVFAILLLAFAAFPAAAVNRSDTVNDIQDVVDGIVDWNLKSAGCAGVREWISGPLAANAGMGSEWYVLALSRNPEYDFSAYEAALKKYLAENTVRSATARLKYALVLRAIGSGNPYIEEALENSVGQQGIMSWVYGLHLLNNGVTCDACTAEDAVSKLLSLQLDDGGWALTGSNGDIDVTAMTLQALAPAGEDKAVAEAAERALAFLSAKQQEDGGYASFGTKNPESAAQVLVALSSLGIDCTQDERFIKNGRTIPDGLMKYRLPDGSFCHKEGDPTNNTATVQAYYSLLSWLWLKEGRGSLYLFPADGEQTASEPAGEPEDPAPAEEPDPAEAAEPVELPPETPDSTDPADAEPAEPEVPGEPEAPPAAEMQDEAPEEPAETVKAESLPSAPGGPEIAEAPEIAEPVQTQEENVETDPPETEPEGTEEKDPSAGGDEKTKPGRFGGYKPKACLIAAGVGALLCLVFLLLGKRHPKNFLAIAGMTAFAVAVILFTDFRSADEYYSVDDAPKSDSVGVVTIEIRCDTVVGKSDADYIPADGVILAETEYEIEEGDTVFDILTEAARQYRIQVETAGRWNMVYVAGINYLYELDFGDLSGWIYHVNGFAPPVGCGEYVLEDGDKIEWLYSCDIGNDLRD